MQELEPQIEALQRGAPVEVASENWVATKTFKSRKGHANKKQPEKCPKQGYTDVLLDLIRSYCRTSRTGSKSSKSSILWGLGRLWTYLFAASRQLHSNWCLGVPAKQGTNKIKDIYLHMFLHIVYTYFAYIQNIRYVYIYNSLIRFNKDKGKKKEQLNSWGGCVCETFTFPCNLLFEETYNFFWRWKILSFTTFHWIHPANDIARHRSIKKWPLHADKSNQHNK